MTVKLRLLRLQVEENKFFFWILNVLFKAKGLSTRVTREVMLYSEERLEKAQGWGSLFYQVCDMFDKKG